MKRYWSVTGIMLATLLALFLVVEALGVPLLSDPSPWLDDGGWVAAIGGVGLLLADVALPVPSSLVMIAHGAAFGVPIGTALSLVGGTGATLVGFAVGRRGGPLLSRFITGDERIRADLLLRRWGTLAIVITRPVPLLAETTAVLAGASSMRWGQAALAGAAGSLPAALLYALTGALAAGVESGFLVFGLVVAMGGAFWLVSRRVDQRRIAADERLASG